MQCVNRAVAKLQGAQKTCFFEWELRPQGDNGDLCPQGDFMTHGFPHASVVLTSQAMINRLMTHGTSETDITILQGLRVIDRRLYNVLSATLACAFASEELDGILLATSSLWCMQKENTDTRNIHAHSLRWRTIGRVVNGMQARVAELVLFTKGHLSSPQDRCNYRRKLKGILSCKSVFQDDHVP